MSMMKSSRILILCKKIGKNNFSELVKKILTETIENKNERIYKYIAGP